MTPQSRHEEPSPDEIARQMAELDAWLGVPQSRAAEVGQLSDGEIPVADPDFATERFGKLRQTWQAIKYIGKTIAERHIYIEHNGYQLGLGTSLRARFARIGMFAGGRSISDADNPVVQKAYANRFNDRSSKSELLAIGAWELGTLAPLRSIGLLAIHGTATATEILAKPESSTARKASRVVDLTTRRLQKHEDGTQNPIVRRRAAAAAVRELMSTDRRYATDEKAAWAKVRADQKSAA